MDNIRVFKSLDKKNSFLGMRGMYFKIMCIAVGVCLGVSLLLMPFIGDFWALMFFGVLCVVCWAFVMKAQSSHSERELLRLLSCRDLPEVIRVEPRSLYKQSVYHSGEADKNNTGVAGTTATDVQSEFQP